MGKAMQGSPTSNTPLGKEIDKLRLEDGARAPPTLNKQLPLEVVVHSHNMEHNVEGDAGPSTSNSSFGEIQIALIQEMNKLGLEDSNKVPSKLNKPLIQKVPQKLRLCYSKNECCDRYFKPTSVAIGPLHRQRLIEKDSSTERGEQCKLKLAAMFIKASQGREEDFHESVEKEINSLKNCYDVEVLEKWNDKDLASMFVVDGCALLHFIVLDVNYDWERFSFNNGLVSIEKMDFFLLENQLPYQLLEILIDSFAKALPPQQAAQNNPKELLKKCIAEFINRSFLILTARHQECHWSSLRLTSQQEHQIQIDHSQPHLLRLLFMNHGVLRRTAQQEHQIQIDHSQQEHQIQIDHSQQVQIDHSQQVQIDHSQQEHQIQIDHSQQEHQIQIDHSQPHHLLDFLRRKLIGEKGGKRKGINKDLLETLISDESKDSPLIRNVRVLRDKGIHFKAREKGSAITNNDFKYRCCMATLTLAPIFLQKTTVTLLLNLIAYELCPGFEENWEITLYLSLLESLIDNAEDAKELKDAGVLHHKLGSDEAVPKLLNKISDIMVPIFKVDPDLRRDIHEYCEKSHFSGLVATVKAKLSHTCFRSPWRYCIFLSTLAALIMTGMQTYYSLHEKKSRN